MSKFDVNLTSIILRQNNILNMMKMQVELTSIPGHSYNVHSLLESRAVTRTLIGGGGGVYSYIHVLPDRFLFKLINLNLILKNTRRAEHEYMNIHHPPPPPHAINVLVTALMERSQIENRQRKITLKRWFERIVSNTRIDLFKTKLKKGKYNVHA